MPTSPSPLDKQAAFEVIRQARTTLRQHTEKPPPSPATLTQYDTIARRLISQRHHPP
jgi:hypothetical protein